MAITSTKAAVLHQYGDIDSITIEDVPIPELQETQILIQMEAAPINVSDLMAVKGHYTQAPTPWILGFEGSGTVVSAGSHPYAQSLIGKRVSTGVTVPGFGTWSEYLLTTAFSVFPLKDDVTFEEGASLIVNPMTVAYFVDKLKTGNHTSLVQNAAASQLGRQLIRWAKLLDITTVNLVRRQEQVDTLRALGAEHVFNTSEEGWKTAAQALTSQLGTSIAFDAIAGLDTQHISDLIKEEGTVYVYGGLSGQPVHISPMSLIGGDKTIKGLWLTK